jgi:hypothetical protein
VAHTAAADAMAALVSTSGTKKPTGLARQIRETKVMMDTDDWGCAKASHLVALYVILHEMIYGVEPELKGDELKQSKMAAGTFLKSRCNGNFETAVAYMKWVWKRERGREEWRRNEHIDGKVLGWRLILMVPSMWTEYRIGQERRKHG